MSSHAARRFRRRAHDRGQVDGRGASFPLSAERRSLARPALFPRDRRCAHGAYERRWVARNFCAPLVRRVLPVRSDEGTRTNVRRVNAPWRSPIRPTAPSHECVPDLRFPIGRAFASVAHADSFALCHSAARACSCRVRQPRRDHGGKEGQDRLVPLSAHLHAPHAGWTSEHHCGPAHADEMTPFCVDVLLSTPQTFPCTSIFAVSVFFRPVRSSASLVNCACMHGECE